MRNDKGAYYLECTSCKVALGEGLFKCPRCGGLPVYKYLGKLRIDRSKPGIWRYSSNLPSVVNLISKGEGLTSINRIDGVLVKNEKLNPTGTYSDRASSVIASYFSSAGVREIGTFFEEDFTYSLAYYLSGVLKMEVLVSDITSANVAELSALAEMDVRLTTRPSPSVQYIEYPNPLTVEGLKTIALEVVERKVRADAIVVPARTGLLAYAIRKGLMEASEAGMDAPYEVIAAFPKGKLKPRMLEVCNDIKAVEVEEEEVLNSLMKLSRRGIKTKPLSALAYTVAEGLTNAVAIVTMGFKPATSRVKGSYIKEEVVRAIKDAGIATAYEVWKRMPTYTLRGIYRVLQSMEKRGEVCSEVRSKGARKVKYYRVC